MKIPPAPAPRRNRGIALLMLLFIVLAFASTWLVSALSKTNVENQRQKRTVAALAQAKEALIAYVAANPDLSGKKRPGDFPCPAMDEGWSPPVVDSCGNSSGTTGQEKRLGRLPWKKLGLPPLRDGSGELLWYAVSNNFKNNTRIPKLDSTTSGTITVRDSSGHSGALHGVSSGLGSDQQVSARESFGTPGVDDDVLQQGNVHADRVDDAADQQRREQTVSHAAQAVDENALRGELNVLLFAVLSPSLKLGVVVCH